MTGNRQAMMDAPARLWQRIGCRGEWVLWTTTTRDGGLAYVATNGCAPDIWPCQGWSSARAAWQAVGVME